MGRIVKPAIVSYSEVLRTSLPRFRLTPERTKEDERIEGGGAAHRMGKRRLPGFNAPARDPGHRVVHVEGRFSSLDALSFPRDVSGRGPFDLRGLPPLL